MNELQLHIDQINSLCLQHNVRSLFAFGSILTDRFNAYNDIDLIVDIDNANPFDYADNYFAFKSRLEDILNKPVDLLEDRAIKNPFLEEQIEQTKVLVCGR